MKKWLGILLAVALCAALLCVGVGASESDAIEISTADELAKIGAEDGYPLSGSYKLTADIDLHGSAENPWTPIGSYDIFDDDDYNYTPFTGTFDGDGHTISGLYINSSNHENYGLFGYVNTNGTVKNLTVSGSVTATNNLSNAGGVVGENLGTVTNCCYTGSVSGSNHVGGVVGENLGTVTNCYNTGSVSGSSSVGGVVGHTSTSGSRISNCYNTGSVSGSSDVGGVVGFNGSSCTVSNCYNTGSVTGANRVGGVVGENYTGTVAGCCYLNTSAGTGIGSGGTATSLTAHEFADKSKFDTAWDFTSVWVMAATKKEDGSYFTRPMLRENLEDGAIVIIGDGKNGTPFEIPNLDTLEYYAGLINSKSTNAQYASAYYLLTQDIDMSGKYGAGKESWTPIGAGDYSFGGTFDGDGHTISGLYINSSDYENYGLFGRVNTSGTVKNLKVSGSVTATTDSSNAGGVVGKNYNGSVINCCYTGSVSGSSNVGGVVGMNLGTVTNCYNTGSVSGSSFVGGVVGYASGGTISNCYNTGSVGSSAANNVGGVVGYNVGSCNVSNCYNTGSVSGSSDVGGVVGRKYSGSVENCYYLTGCVTSSSGNNIGTSITAEQFAVANSFTDWDFDGKDAVWTMDADLGRPVLIACRETFEVKGDGTSKTPFEIPNLATLVYFRNHINDGGKYTVDGKDYLYSAAFYKLTGDIDMNPGYTYDPDSDTWRENGSKVTDLTVLNNWTPIGTDRDLAFTGTFDGGNYTISGLYINAETSDSSYFGLFGYVRSGTLTNIKVVGDINVANSSKSTVYIGGIAGYCAIRGTSCNITDCTFTGSIVSTSSAGSKGSCNVGGIAGFTQIVFADYCVNHGDISGYGVVGGLFGYYNSGGEIDSCYNTGTVTANGNESNVGGLAGNAVGTNVIRCYNTGYVTAEGESSRVGGLFGTADDAANVDNCHNEGTVTAHGTGSSVGGLVGMNSGSISNNSYNTGDVTADGSSSNVGGVAGYNYYIPASENKHAQVTNSYNTGAVTAKGSESNVGGVVGNNYNENTSKIAKVTSSYNTGAVSSGDNSMIGGVVGMNSGGYVGNCYNIGAVSDEDNSTVGGVVGSHTSGTVTNCYYLTQDDLPGVGSDSENTGAISKNETEFTSGAVAWLLQKERDNGSSLYWVQELGTGENTYPVLSDGTANSVYKVAFMNGSTEFAAGYANKGGSVPLPNDNPTRDNMQFIGWFNSETGGTKYDSSVTVASSDIMVYARFEDKTVTVGSVTLSETELTLDVGEIHKLIASVEPDGAASVTWSSSDVSVATVDGNGVVTAVAPGTATITATAGGVSAECTVTVRTASGSVPDPTYKPVIDAPEGVEVTTDPARPKPGDTVTVTTEPDGTITVTDKDGNPVDVTRNPDGTWTYVQPEGAVKITVTPGVPELPFTDVSTGAWYYDAISFVYANGLMDGVSDTLFNPDGNMTRAMVWAILARMDGETVTGANWIETARAWAMSEGVSDGTDPNGLVTREQLATMLWRYAGVPASEYSLSAYTDADDISAWALDAMRWAVENGIISGVTATTLDPQGTATRAQCAAILMRYIANI